MKDKEHNFSDEALYFKRIRQRVREKSQSYDRYNFSGRYDDFLKTFFDLAQEFDSLEDFYRICVAVPLEMTGLHSALCLYQKKKLCLVCDSERGVLPQPEPVNGLIRLYEKPGEVDDSYIIPICSKPTSGESPPDELSQPVRPQDTLTASVKNSYCHVGRILGMYRVWPLKKLSLVDRFFFTKYANRIGYKLHNRMLAEQNVDHLKFINSLVKDIEHNVIVPNMYFLYLFNILKKKIGGVDELVECIPRLPVADDAVAERDKCFELCNNLRRELFACHEQLVKHHANISLFLESLFRREHFQQGHLVLRMKHCFVVRDIVMPQLEYYAGRLRTAGVNVEQPVDLLDDDERVLVDVGLISQVFANLFSNAAKYTREVIDQHGKPRKVMSCDREIVDDFQGTGANGVKYSVFTTGPHLAGEEVAKISQDGFRGKDSKGLPGTGHGLAFVRHVVEMHGGCMGYEAVAAGNVFYFILPLPVSADEDVLGD